MKKLALSLVLAFVAVACNRASDKDVGKMITLWNEVTDGYLKVLEANQKEPKKAIEEGKKYIETDAKVKELAKMGDLKGTQEQVDRFTKAVEASQTSIQGRIKVIAEAMVAAGDVDSANALADQWRDLVNTALGQN